MAEDVHADLINRTLERASEQLGDITGAVYSRFYARCPRARASFATLDAGNPARLEGTMVEQALYCLMRWHESPGEIEIILMTTIPHHIETLDVDLEQFGGLLDAVCDVIAGSIPADALDELTAWQELRDTLLGICTEAASHARADLVRRVA